MEWLLVYSGNAINWCLTQCTFEIQFFFEARYWGSDVCDRSALGLSVEVVVVVSGVVAVVLW